MRKAIKIGFIGVFCAVIGLEFQIFNIFSKQLSMDSHENRLMTGLPQVLQSPLSQLPRRRRISANCGTGICVTAGVRPSNATSQTMRGAISEKHIFSGEPE